MKMISESSRLVRSAGVFMLASSLVLAGCDTEELLQVSDPDTVNPGTLQDPDLIDIVVTGAIGEFTSGYSSGDSYITVTALMSDEFFSSGTFTTRTATDRREQFSAANGNTSDGSYINFQQARRALKDAAAQVADVLGTSDAAYGRLKALEGYTYVALAEGWCSSIPISNVGETGEFEYGQPTTTATLLSEAVVRFDESIAAGGPFANLGAVGKGRALLSAGNYAGAASAVAAVPTSYVYFINHSDNAVNNPIYSLQENGRYSISDFEGGNETGLGFRSAADPRVQFVLDPAGGFDPNYALYKSLKYTAFSAPVVLASGVEARLIEAEAALAANQPAQMLAKLNDLRANVATLMAGLQPGYVSSGTLDPVADPGTAAGRRDLLFQERAFWLFLTGQRLSDLRRLVRDYGLSQAAVYPSGTYHKGGDHGVDVVFEVDFDEANNPNFELTMCNVESVS